MVERLLASVRLFAAGGAVTQLTRLLFLPCNVEGEAGGRSGINSPRGAVSGRVGEGKLLPAQADGRAHRKVRAGAGEVSVGRPRPRGSRVAGDGRCRWRSSLHIRVPSPGCREPQGLPGVARACRGVSKVRKGESGFGGLTAPGGRP